MTIGEKIKQRRKELGLSAEELGAAIGKGRATIYRYENGEINDMPYTVIVPIAKALHISPESLFFDKTENIDEKADVIARITNDPDMINRLNLYYRLSKEDKNSIDNYFDFIISNKK